MSNDTHNSRLRVLVAKTFRAEKLYSSMRNAEVARLSGKSQLSELSNDIRAREWQRNHYQLRTALNDILSSGAETDLPIALEQLCEQFGRKIKESTDAIFQSTARLQSESASQEFAQCLHIVVDLIRHRARLQACRAIREELLAILSDENNSKAVDSADNHSVTAKSNLIDFQKRAASGGRSHRS